MPQINPNQIPSNNRNQFIQQLTNQAAGDYATINTAITFKEHMTTAFMQKLSPDSPLRQSMDKNKSSQTQLFSLMQSGNILSQKQTNPIFDNHFNGTTDNKAIPRQHTYTRRIWVQIPILLMLYSQKMTTACSRLFAIVD